MLVTASRRFLSSIYQFDEVLNRSTKSLNIHTSARASTFVKTIFATTCGMYAVTIEQHSVPFTHHVHVIAKFAFTQWHSILAVYVFQATAPTEQHPHLVELTPEDVVRKKQKDPPDGVKVRVRMEI